MGERNGLQALGIIGDPIGHTLSPTIHQLFGVKNRIALQYVPYQVKKEVLEDAVRGAHALGIRGLNVTVPHKSAVIPYLSSVDPAAERIGAVNTLVYEDGGYRGYNTDISGLRRAILEAGAKLEGARVIILGAGGAARAAVYLAAMDGAEEIVILNRTRDKAEALADEVNERIGRRAVRADDSEAFIRKLNETDVKERYLAIQCTSVGLWPDTEHAAVEDPAFFRSLSCAVDIVYRPFETKFLRLAREAGIPAVGGLSMLLYQAADAFERWFPDVTLRDSDLSCVMTVLKGQVLGFTEVSLIGFMGSGKTTVADALAAALGYTVWDTDRMIEEACGKSVSDIFAQDGEETFRRLETETLRRIGEALDEPWQDDGNGVVLSTGGGLPLKEENRELMRSGAAKVVYLRVQPETVIRRLSGDDTRPLLKGTAEEKQQRISSLLAERDPVYRSCADLIVDVDDRTPAQIVTLILKGLSGDAGESKEER